MKFNRDTTNTVFPVKNDDAAIIQTHPEIVLQ